MNHKEIIELACRAGKIVLESGGEIYRVEQTMTAICEAYGIMYSESFATPTVIILSSGENNEHDSRMMRITQRRIDLNKIDAVNKFSRNPPKDPGKAMDALEAIEKSKVHPIWLKLIASGVGAACFTLIFGGSKIDFFCGLLLGVFLNLVLVGLAKKSTGDFMVNLIGGAFAALGGWVAGTIFQSTNSWIVTVSAMMLLVPGLLFTNAMRDIAAGDLVSGGSRIIEVLSVAAALASGAAAAHAVLSLIGGVI